MTLACKLISFIITEYHRVKKLLITIESKKIRILDQLCNLLPTGNQKSRIGPNI